MNILIPHTWLKDHLDTKADPKAIQTNLSLCGPSVERIEKIGSDHVYDIEVTTNRVDAMSVRGIAREAAAILPEFDIQATLKPIESLLSTNLPSSKPLDLQIINDETICKRILAIKLSIPKINPSPTWLKNRLEQVGQRPLNSVVDITNYVMWEIGHPTHVFDYDKFTQKKLIVRKAKKGEKIITLDHKTHFTVGGEVIFEDGEGTIIDIPGIMGTHNTVVDDKTTNILFFVDSVNAEMIRFASMTHQIRTQAAILNEKHVDPNLGLIAIQRGLKLYQEVCDAKIESQLVDIYPHPSTLQTVILNQAHLDTYLGVHIEPTRVVSILEHLGCKVTIKDNKGNITYQITPPSDRSDDLTIYQDIIEEVARIYGYHNLPSVVMPTTIPDNPPSEDFAFEHYLKTLLSGWGASEIYSFSMISESQAMKSGYELTNHLKIKNPLLDDWVYMRRSLIPSLTEVFHTNPGKIITTYELQNVYHPARKLDDLPQELLQLSIASNQSYSHLKGLLESLFDKLYIENWQIDPHQQQSPSAFSQHAGIRIGDKTIGYIGKLAHQIYALELDIAILQNLSSKHPKYLPINLHPPIIEDLTFSIPAQTYVGPIIGNIKAISKLIEKVTIKDTYQKSSSSATNVTFTITYRHSNRPLTDQEIAPIRKKIVADIEKKVSAQLIGHLS